MKSLPRKLRIKCSTYRRSAARRWFVPIAEPLEKRLAPAVFLVEPALDLRDDNPGDGTCRSIDPATGLPLVNPTTGALICTLRAAIQEANALKDTDPAGNPLADEIILKQGLYTLNQANARLNTLPINSELTIRADSASGANASNTIIDAGGRSSVFEVFAYFPRQAAPLDVSEIAGVTIRNGLANWGGGINTGPGLAGTSLKLLITDCTVDNNHARDEGGGIFIGAGTVTIRGSTFSHNTADVSGGGLFNHAEDPSGATPSLRIVNSTFSQNTAERGGGIYYGHSFEFPPRGPGGSISLVHVSDVGNLATAGGGGLAGNTAALATLQNTIIAGNSGGNCGGVTLSADTHHNLEDAHDCGLDPAKNNLIDTEPQMLPFLADNGGPTKTHVLLAGSPAIDAGDRAATQAAGLTTDQRGLPRDFGAAPDLGSYELQMSNHPPLAQDDTLLIPPDVQSWRVYVTLNDFDPDSDGLTIDSFTQGVHGGIVRFFADDPGVLFYTPNVAPGLARDDQFEYTISDGRGGSDTATVFVTLNQKPAAGIIEYVRPHNATGPFTIDAPGLLASTFDSDHDPLTLRVSEQPQNGTVTLRLDSSGKTDGSFTYTPTTPDGHIVRDSFSFIASDGIEESDPIVVGIRVENTPPASSGGVIPAAHGTRGSLTGAFPFVEFDGDEVQVIAEDDPRLGTATLTVVDSRVEIEYLPNGGRAIGSDRLTYRLSDGYELSAPITIEIQVPNNSPIVIIPPGQESAGYWEKNVVVTPTGSLPTSGTLYCQNINVDARFAFLPISDAPDLDLVFEQDGDPLTPILVGQPAHGTVTLVPVDLPDDGCTTRYRYEYQPYPPLMKVSEILLGNVVQEMFDEFPARVPAIREAAGRLGGFANAEFLSTDEFLQSATSALIDNVPVVIALTDEEVQRFQAKLASVVAPDLFVGPDTFSFSMTDGAEASADVIYVTIGQTMGDVIMRTDAYTVAHDAELHIGGPGPLANDAFASGMLLTQRRSSGQFQFVGDVWASAPHIVQIRGQDAEDSDQGPLRGGVLVSSHGQFPDPNDEQAYRLQLDEDGSVVYRPNAELRGVFDFTYQFSYVNLSSTAFPHLSPPGRVLIDVTQDPESDSDGISDEIERDVPTRSGVDGDGDGDHGSDYLQDNVASFHALTDAADWVTLKAGPGTTLFGVQAHGPPHPSEAPRGATFPLGHFSYWIVGLEPGGAATVTLYPPLGVQVDGMYLYHPLVPGASVPPGFMSFTSFIYDGRTGAEFFDENGDGFNERIVIHYIDGERGDSDGEANGIVVDPLAPTRLIPITMSDSYVVAEDAALQVDAPGVLANDTSTTGALLAALLVSGPAHGTLDLRADGSFDYVPNVNFSGGDSFTYKASDGLIDSDVAIVMITVDPVNDPPVASAVGPSGGLRGQTLTFTFSASDADPEDNAAGFTYRIDWNGDASVDQVVSGPSGMHVDHVFAEAGDLIVRVTALDQHGAASGEIAVPIVITNPAPVVQSIVVNDGDVQRSMINSITITFDRLVVLDTGAIELWKQGRKKPLHFDLAVTAQSNHTLARLTFKSQHVVGGSLSDGNYRLLIHGNRIHDSGGNLLDGDGDGVEGGDHIDAFFRLFGDTDGDGDVDGTDKKVFEKAYGKRANQPGYLWYLDANANGRIWAEELALFILGAARNHRRW